MTFLFGLFSPGGETVPEGLLARIEHGCDWPRDRVLRREAPGVALLALQRDTVPRLRETRLAGPDGAALMFSGRIDNREELAARYELGPAEALDDDDLVRGAWRAEGARLCDALIGDFAIAIHDPATRRLLLARDHLGTTPLYRARVGPFVAFASTIAGLRLVPGIDLAWDERWLAEMLVAAKTDFERTGYRAIGAVPPAHVLTFDEAGEARRRYWSLATYDAPVSIAPEEATAEFRRLFDQAVACRLRAPGEIACELSGGVDSSAVAATAADQLARRGKRLLAFAHVLEESAAAQGLSVVSERHHAEAVGTGVPGIDLHCAEDPLESLVATLQCTLDRHGVPPRNDINAHAGETPKALRARDVRVLLSGFGGDQVATWPGGGYVESLLAERDWAALRKHTVSRHGPVAGWLHWALYRSGIGGIGLARRAEIGLEGRYSEYAELADPAFLAAQIGTTAIDPRGHRARSGTMRAREAAAIAAPSVAYRVQDSAVGAGAHGFVYRYPMLDIRLLEFAHNLPARLKRTPEVRRRMIREAMAGRLPDKVRLRPDKTGSTFPAVQLNALLHATELRALIAAHTDDPRVAPYVRIDRALATLERGMAQGDFDGPLSLRHVLRLAMLCLWSRRDRQ